MVAGFGEVHAPFGLGTDAGGAALELLTQLTAVDPIVASAATEHLVRLVLSFRSSMVQAIAVLPVIP